MNERESVEQPQAASAPGHRPAPCAPSAAACRTPPDAGAALDRDPTGVLAEADDTSDIGDEYEPL